MFYPNLKNRDAVFPKIKKKAFPEIMTYIKKTTRGDLFNPETFRTNSGFFYLSSCPLCSVSFGNIQLSFTFSPMARVIIIDHHPERPTYDWERAKEELEQTYPKVFSSCEFEKMGIFAIEDSGIDIIKYDTEWYQITNFEDVVNSDVLVFPTSHH